MKLMLKRTVLVAVATCAIGLISGSTALAQDSGFYGPCTGEAYSYDRDDNLIDSASRVGDNQPVNSEGVAVFTKENPFKVAPGGTIRYQGQAQDAQGNPAVNNSYYVSVNVPFIGSQDLFSGLADNDDRSVEDSGQIDLEALDVAKSLGKVKLPVGFSLTSQYFDCGVGEAWVIIGKANAITATVPVAIAIVGLIGIWRAKGKVSSLFAGILTGLGVSLAAITNALTSPVDNATLYLVLAGFVAGTAKAVKLRFDNKVDNNKIDTNKGHDRKIDLKVGDDNNIDLKVGDDNNIDTNRGDVNMSTNKRGDVIRDLTEGA